MTVPAAVSTATDTRDAMDEMEAVPVKAMDVEMDLLLLRTAALGPETDPAALAEIKQEMAEKEQNEAAAAKAAEAAEGAKEVAARAIAEEAATKAPPLT